MVEQKAEAEAKSEETGAALEEAQKAVSEEWLCGLADLHADIRRQVAHPSHTCSACPQPCAHVCPDLAPIALPLSLGCVCTPVPPTATLPPPLPLPPRNDAPLRAPPNPPLPTPLLLPAQRDLLKRNHAIIRGTESNIEEELERVARVVREERDKGKLHLADRAKHRKKLAEVVGECGGAGRGAGWVGAGGIGRAGSAIPRASSCLRYL